MGLHIGITAPRNLQARKVLILRASMQFFEPLSRGPAWFYHLVVHLNILTDQETPKINNIPANITQATDSGLPTATVTWIEPVAIDNSGSQTLTSTQDSGSLFDIGVTLVTYTSVDAAGHKTSVTFSVTIEGKKKKKSFNNLM